MTLRIFAVLSTAILVGCGTGAAGSPAASAGAQGGSAGSDGTAVSGGSGGARTATGGAGGSSPACLGSCDDGFTCTVDTCVAGTCRHSIGPNEGATACPPAQYCTVEDGCVGAPACATDADCTAAWSGDACKTNVRCDPASSVCLFDILDKDHDGHAPQVCGGDDCDDSDRSVNPDASEVCDGLDNDCDGAVDDGASCGSVQTCQQGACVCRPEYTCGNSCTDMRQDPQNCGACGKACPAGSECDGGACTCPAPRLSCKGACIDPTDDDANCGACGRACPSVASCRGGACVCPNAGETACGAECIDLQTNAAHCGTCSTACTADRPLCVGGACLSLACADTCFPCSVDVDCCDGNVCNAGFCESSGGSVGFGGAPNSCSAGETLCTPPAGYACGQPYCANTRTDQLSCGACGTRCRVGGCVAGVCTGCPVPQVKCDGVCVDVTSDSAHCGACTTVCGNDEQCIDGQCVGATAGCSGTEIECDAICVDPMTDTQNCGACGNVCLSGQSCAGGVCG